MQLLSLARCSSKSSQLSTRQSVTAQAKTRTISGGVLGEWLKLPPCSPKHTIHLIHALQTGTHAWCGGTWQGPATDRWLRHAHGSSGLTLRQPLTLCQPSQVVPGQESQTIALPLGLLRSSFPCFGGALENGVTVSRGARWKARLTPPTDLYSVEFCGDKEEFVSERFLPPPFFCAEDQVSD